MSTLPASARPMDDAVTAFRNGAIYARNGLSVDLVLAYRIGYLFGCFVSVNLVQEVREVLAKGAVPEYAERDALFVEGIDDSNADLARY